MDLSSLEADRPGGIGPRLASLGHKVMLWLEIVGAGFDRGTAERVLRLVRISEWKRRQAAPGPKLSRRAFGRERRYPITSGWRD